MQYEYYTFYSLQEILDIADRMNTYWGFDRNNPLRTTYFDENSFQYDEIAGTWSLIKDKWSEFLGDI